MKIKKKSMSYILSKRGLLQKIVKRKIIPMFQIILRKEETLYLSIIAKKKKIVIWCWKNERYNVEVGAFL